MALSGTRPASAGFHNISIANGDLDHPGYAFDRRKREAQAEKEQQKPKREYDDLDEALADTFPASDPPAPVVHGTTSNPRPAEKDYRFEKA
jgi:hypothetical protein